MEMIKLKRVETKRPQRLLYMNGKVFDESKFDVLGLHIQSGMVYVQKGKEGAYYPADVFKECICQAVFELKSVEDLKEQIEKKIDSAEKKTIDCLKEEAHGPRLCKKCDNELPADAHHAVKYCDECKTNSTK